MGWLVGVGSSAIPGVRAGHRGRLIVEPPDWGRRGGRGRRVFWGADQSRHPLNMRGVRQYEGKIKGGNILAPVHTGKVAGNRSRERN